MHLTIIPKHAQSEIGPYSSGNTFSLPESLQIKDCIVKKWKHPKDGAEKTDSVYFIFAFDLLKSKEKKEETLTNTN